jgi:hypothetical protein
MNDRAQELHLGAGLTLKLYQVILKAFGLCFVVILSFPHRHERGSRKSPGQTFSTAYA